MLKSGLNVAKCNDCPRECNVNRLEKNGFCGVGDLKVARASLHYGEEPIISGEKGSGTVFLSGCNLRCVYCQNYDISNKRKGYSVSHKEMSEIIKKLEAEGANNINFVTPSHQVQNIIKVLDIYKPKIPVCFNTSSYDKVETILQLKDYVDIYLADLKYSQNYLAKDYSKVEDYYQVSTNAIMAMRATVGQDLVSEGLMKKGLVVRHLVLPNQVENSKEIIDWVCDNLGVKTYFSLMSQYVPCGEAMNIKGLDRVLKPLEYKIVTNYIIKTNMQNVFLQKLSSGNAKYIPEFFGDSNKEK